MDEAERRAAMRRGQDDFNRGDFYEAHEHWEDVWNELDDPERVWVQGLIQVATGLHKLSRARPDVCATLLHKALDKLARHGGAPATLDGVDVASARAGAERILAALDGGGLPDPRSVRLATPDGEDASGKTA